MVGAGAGGSGSLPLAQVNIHYGVEHATLAGAAEHQLPECDAGLNCCIQDHRGLAASVAKARMTTLEALNAPGSDHVQAGEIPDQ